MNIGYLNLLIPIIAILVNVFIQISFYKFHPNLGLLKSEYVGFAFGFCFVLIAISATNLIIYFCLGYLYFTFINLGETARRIRLLRELLDAKEGLSLEEMLNRYNAKEIVEKRIKRLERNGQIVCRNGSYYIGSNFLLLIAKIIVLIKLIVLGKKSEFD